MDFDCKLSNAEMREAFRMNQTWRFWMQMIRHNLFALVFTVAIAIGIATNLSRHQRPDWTSIGIALAFEAMIVGFYWWRVSRQVKKMATQVNTTCERMTVDARGIGTSTGSGLTTFSPWSQYKRWKEGKLVFTVGNAKVFCTIPKGAMNEMQVGEVRGILQSQIR